MSFPPDSDNELLPGEETVLEESNSVVFDIEKSKSEDVAFISLDVVLREEMVVGEIWSLPCAKSSGILT